MLLNRRRNGSQRAMRSMEATHFPVADRVSTAITFEAGGVWYDIVPQTDEECRNLIDDLNFILANRKRR